MRNQTQDETFDKQDYLNKLLSGQLKQKNSLLNNILEESKGSDAQTVASNARAIANQIKNSIPEPMMEESLPVHNYTFGEQAINSGPTVTEEMVARLTGKPMPKTAIKQAPIFENKTVQQPKVQQYGLDKESLNEIKANLRSELLEEMKEEINMYIIEIFSKQRIKNILKEIYTESKAK